MILTRVSAVENRQWTALCIAICIEGLLLLGGATVISQQSTKIMSMVVPLLIETPMPVDKGLLKQAPMAQMKAVVPVKEVMQPQSSTTPLRVQPLSSVKALPFAPAEPSKPELLTPPMVDTLAPITASVATISPRAASVAASIKTQDNVSAPMMGESPELVATYNAKLTAAVQAAFEVPLAASSLGFKGRARVEFNLQDAQVLAPRIVQTSGLGAVDRAAIKAVLAAKYPQPPSSLQGKNGLYQIWVACF
jgi:periplasmic protein TonB